jgi:hypothetical protein
MANVLLKNVKAAAPANGSVTVRSSANRTYPQSLTVAIVDTLGQPIDATAGTVSTTFHADTNIIGKKGFYSSVETYAGPSPTIDLTVPGKMTINFPFLSAVTQGNQGTWNMSITATDSAGGTEQLLFAGTLTGVQVDGP